MEHLVTLGKAQSGRNVTVPVTDLTRHVAVFGASGSGKSGALIGLTEDVILSGTPVVLIDIKGDLLNIAVQPSSQFASRMDVRFVTPQGGLGEPVSLLAGINNRSRRAKTISLLLDKVGLPSSPTTGPYHAYLCAIIDSLNRAASLVDLIYGATSDRVKFVGALPVSEFISTRQRNDLAAKLNAFYTSDQMRAYRDGRSLDLDALLSTTNGKTPVLVYGVSHIVEDADRNFAIGMFMDTLVDWMRTKGGTTKPRVFVAIDECMGLLPPHPFTSPAKDPILTVLKQGRAFGVCLLLASQNPKDIDYKALSNCNTWVVGTLRTTHDRSRVLEGASLAGNDTTSLDAVLKSLKQREFVLLQPGHVEPFRTKDTHAVLVGPMDESSVQSLYGLGTLRYPSESSTLEQEYLESVAYYDANPCQENRATMMALHRKLHGPTQSKFSSFVGRIFA